MTEVASLIPADHRLTTVKHYEAGPPIGLELVEPGETFATTKEEEWVSKKKTEVTNTKQIETRVKRQVVLEDGKVVEDSGPIVSTNTTEDTETQEHHQTELRKLGDDEIDGPKALEDGPNDAISEIPKWVPVANPDGIVREVKERRVVSREETEEVKETEDVQHMGDITDEEFLSAVRSGKSDLRSVLRTSDKGRLIVSSGPSLIHESSKSKKVTDTEDTRELSSVLPDGKIVTETQRTTEHEEVKDDELPEDSPVQDYQKESSQRYVKTREQEDVDYVADGVNVGHEMRYKTENMEVERRGDGIDEPDMFDSLSARARRRNNQRTPHRYRGVENGENTTATDRKDALTRRPLNFDQEEETRKVETSKWLDHHFGSDSRSSTNSTLDDEEQPPKTSFFNVTIKSQPARNEDKAASPKPFENSRVYSPVEPERDGNHTSGYYQANTEWTEKRQERYQSPQRQSPLPYQSSTPYPAEHLRHISPSPDYNVRRSPVPDYRQYHTSISSYRNHNHQPNTPEFGRPTRMSPHRDIDISPIPPQRKRATERQKQQNLEKERSRHQNGYGTNSRSNRNDEIREHHRIERIDRVEEPPPDYSPPSPPPMPTATEKKYQKTRFAVDTPKPKSGNIIGQSIRKLVGKIRSVSAERKAKQRAKRSPSPSYKQGHIIDSNISQSSMDRQPVQRYYLGEDPFGGSIYGRENKYDGVKPARNSRRTREDERRSQSTLGRFSKSTGRLVNHNASVDEDRASQTLPRHLNRRHEAPTKLERNNIKTNSKINVSIINTVSSPRIVTTGDAPAKPARTYKSNLSRSKSFNVHDNYDYSRPNMYTSNPQLHRLDENPIGLKSPGLISSLNRSQKDISEDVFTSRFHRNGDSVDTVRHPEDGEYRSNFTERNKRVFMSNLKDKAPELFKTLNDDDKNGEWRTHSYNTTMKTSSKNYSNGDIYEPPTRLRDTHVISPTPSQSLLRRGSTSSTDFSETYHTTTRNTNPHRPSITNTTKTISKKTIPGKDGRSLETIESSETKSVTKSHMRGVSEPTSVKFYDTTERRYKNGGANPVVIEVRNNYRK